MLTLLFGVVYTRCQGTSNFLHITLSSATGTRSFELKLLDADHVPDRALSKILISVMTSLHSFGETKAFMIALRVQQSLWNYVKIFEETDMR